MRKFFKFMLPLILIIGSVFIVIALVVYQSSQTAERKDETKKAVLVDTIEAEVVSLNFTVNSQGTVIPRTETTLVSEVSGKIVSVAPGFVNRGRDAGLPIDEAVRGAAKSRFRAILLTSLTTFLGLAPIAIFETSLQAQIVVPMAASLAFGILFATVITLFLIPTLYLILDDLKQWWKEAWTHMLPQRNSKPDTLEKSGQGLTRRSEEI